MGRMATAFLCLIALGACSADDDDDGGGDAAAADTVSASADDALATAGTTAGGSADAEAPAEASEEEGAARSLRQLVGPSIAIEAQATVRAEDVRGTVDRLTGFVVRRGGRIASADVDYAPDVNERGTEESRATLVLAVPPAELAAVVAHLEDLGTVLAFDQLAEDVTEQLVDLDSRIRNTRASVERVRALLAEATDIDGIVRLESELTDREIELETLLASQRSLEERVAMSTLTVEVVAAPRAAFGVVRHEFEPGRPGLVEALGDGWGAFVTGGYAVVLAAATVLPFLAVAALVVVVLVWVRRTVRRDATTASRQV